MNRPARKNFTSRTIPQKTTSCSLFRSQRRNEELEKDMCHTDIYAYIKVFGTDEHRARLVELKSKVRRVHLLPLYREVLNFDYFSSEDFMLTRAAYELSKNANYKNELANLVPGLDAKTAKVLVFRVERLVESRNGINNNRSRKAYEKTLAEVFSDPPVYSAEDVRAFLKGVFQ
jgi:hypothetical protein